MRIAIIGAGVVGQATGRGLNEHGHKVTFVDVNPEVIARLTSQGLSAMRPHELNLDEQDMVMLSVPTLTDYETGLIPDHLVAATHSLAERLSEVTSHHYPIIIYRCTMLMGMTLQMTDLLEQVSGKREGHDFGVGYQPEYLRAESADEDFLKPRMVTISAVHDNPRVLEMLRELYLPFGAPIEQLSPMAAEFQKYVHNNGNAVIISAFNALRIVGEEVGLSADEINQAFGITVRSADFKAMPTYGTKDLGYYDGACLPKDIGAMLVFGQNLLQTRKRFVSMPWLRRPSQLDQRLRAAVAFLKATQSVNRALGGK